MIPKVNKFRLISSSALAAGYVICALAASAQESRYERFRAHNTTMTALQPAWMGPLIQSDSRLSQAIRLSVSNSYCPTQTVNYGNGHGIAVMAGTRFQFDYMQPAYVQNNSAKTKDGIGDTETQIKYRIASGNAEHGNFAVSAILAQTFPTGSHKNGAATSVYFPKLAVGKARGRFNVQPVLSGVIPTGKIAAQGRGVERNGADAPEPQCVARRRGQRSLQQGRSRRRENAELYHAGGFLHGAAQELETNALSRYFQRGHADCNFGVPFL